MTDDYNGAMQEGFARIQMTLRNGRRCSAATAFLRPAMKRSNLTIKTGALVTRFAMEGTRAVGVEYVQNGQTDGRAPIARLSWPGARSTRLSSLCCPVSAIPTN